MPPAGSGIVCIGFSAGGLRSLQVVMRDLDEEFPWPVLITQHFPADIRSHLPEILGNATSLPVREAVEGQALEPGVGFTCPSGAAMGVAPDETITLQPRKRGPPSTVDHLFATAAAAAGPGVVAVVLSGFGSDGAAGCCAVKERGGTFIAESSATAEWTGMPSATIGVGPVDAVLPSHEIGRELVRRASRSSFA